MKLFSLMDARLLTAVRVAALGAMLAAPAAQANDVLNPNIVSHELTGKVSFLSNTQPFGFDLEIGDAVTVTVMYDKTVPGTQEFSTSVYDQTIVDGLMFEIGGKTLATSEYEIRVLDQSVDNYNFRSETGTLATGGLLTVSPLNLRWGLNFQDDTGVLLDSEQELLDSLVPLSQFTQASGFIQNTETFELIRFDFDGVPEPASLSMLGGLGVLLLRRRRG